MEGKLIRKTAKTEQDRGILPSAYALFCAYNTLNCRAILLTYPHSALCLEGGTVCALRHSGIGFVGNYLDLGKSAIVILSAMVRTLSNGATDGLVGSVAGAFASAGVGVFVHYPEFLSKLSCFFASLTACIYLVCVF